MPSLRNNLRGFVLLCLLMACFAVPRVSFAANSTTCECFCGDSTNGAVDADPQVSAAACSKICNDTHTRYVGCFVDSRSYPINDEKCWTEDECTSWTKVLGGVRYNGSWGGQGVYCSKTQSEVSMGYCYGPSIPVNLNIPVLGQATVSGLPEYLAIAYNFLIPAMALIAVVMLMAGGLGYATARGNSKAVDKAKTRITNALIGLILLLSAYATTSFIDPRLVNFNALKVPLVKTVVLLDASSSCEALSDVNYGISPTAGFCGSSGTITSVDNVTANVSASLNVGGVCKFASCEDHNSACQADGTCVTCSSLPYPSSSTCATAEHLSSDQNQTQYYCRYDGTLRSCVTAVRDQPTNGYVFSGSVEAPGFHCGTMRSEAKESGIGCLQYSQVLQVSSSTGVTNMKDSSDGAMILQTICTADPCGLASQVSASGCSYTADTTKATSGTCDNIGGTVTGSEGGSGLSASPTM